MYPNSSQDADGTKRLFRQFSFPGDSHSLIAALVMNLSGMSGVLAYTLYLYKF